MAVDAVSSASDPLASIRDNPASKKKAVAGSMEAAQDRFMTLLITQLKNQDPLNPMENAEMTSQLAQMSTVTGIEKLNATVASMINSLGEMQTMQAANMIGSNVMVAGNGIYADGKGNVAFGAVDLPSPAEKVTVKIMDKDGKVVAEQDYGKQDQGVMRFAWQSNDAEGAALKEGRYSFRVEASDAAGKKMETAAMQIGTVIALTRENGKFVLDLGALGKTDMGKVQQIL